MTSAASYTEDYINPTLHAMGMYSPAASLLLAMTANHESGHFQWRRQLHGGPALSFFQIEPATLHDLYDNYLMYRPELMRKLDMFRPDNVTKEDALLYHDKYACAAARLIYYRRPEALPPVENLEALAAYWKQHYNTPEGKGTVDKMLKDWENRVL
jgi:hypothetical protein